MGRSPTVGLVVWPLLAGIRSSIHYGMKSGWVSVATYAHQGVSDSTSEELVQHWSGWPWVSINQDCQGLHTLVRDTLNPMAVAMIPVIMNSNEGHA